MKVYVVQAIGYGMDGHIHGVFADRADAEHFLEHGQHLNDVEAAHAEIYEYELWYGQRLWSQRD